MFFQREPRILEMSELCSSGLLFRIFRLSSLAQIMKAFIGLLMWFFLSLHAFSCFSGCWKNSFFGGVECWGRRRWTGWQRAARLSLLRLRGISWGTLSDRPLIIFLWWFRKSCNLRTMSRMLTWLLTWLSSMVRCGPVRVLTSTDWLWRRTQDWREGAEGGTRGDVLSHQDNVGLSLLLALIINSFLPLKCQIFQKGMALEK